MDSANNVPTSAFVYTSKEVCTSLGIASSTLRSWCLRLESEGYIFKRDKQSDSGSNEGSRMFFERDITALRMMKDLLDKKHPLDYAVEQISSKYKAMTPPVSNDIREIVPVTLPSSERFTIPLEIKEQLLAEFRSIVKEEIREEVRQEMASAKEHFFGQIDNVAIGLQEEIRKAKEQSNAHLGQINEQLSEIRLRVETHKRKKFLGLF